MSNSTILYRLRQEVLSTIAISKALLTTLGIEDGYRALYRLEDTENTVSRNLLYMYLFALELWRDWDGVLPLICNADLVELLRRTQSIYESVNTGEFIDPDQFGVSQVSLGNIFGGSQLLITGTPTNGVTMITTAPTIKVIYEEYVVGDVGSPIEDGQTAYTVNYPNIIQGSIELRLPGSNVPQTRITQFSYTVSYSTTDAVIHFINIVNDINIGVKAGTLVIIKGLRY